MSCQVPLTYNTVGQNMRLIGFRIQGLTVLKTMHMMPITNLLETESSTLNTQVALGYVHM